MKRRVLVKETELSKKGIPLTGRQILRMLYDNFKITDHEGVLLDWDEITHVQLKGDNLAQFLSDWEQTLLQINPDVIPGDEMLETLFKKQLMRSDQLTQAMALYDQDVTQRRA